MKINPILKIYNYISVTDLIFIVAFSLYCIANMMEISIVYAMNNVEYPIVIYIVKFVRYLSYLLFAMKIVYDLSIRINYLIFLMAVMVLIAGNFIIGDDRTFIFYFFVFFASRNVKSDIIIKNYFCVVLPILIMYVLFSQFGIVNDYIFDVGTRNRHFLGFSWTTSAPIIFLFLSYCYIYIIKGQVGIKSTAVFMLLFYYFYKMTDTKLAFGVSAASIIFFYLFKNNRLIKYLTKKMSLLFVLFPFIMALIAYAVTMMYTPHDPLWENINDLLTGRLKIGKMMISKYGVHLFGNRIKWVGHPIFSKAEGEYNYVDSSYLRILVQFGILFLILILILYSIQIYISIKSERYYLTWIMLLICIFSVTEPRLFNLTFNPFPLIFLSEIYEYSKSSHRYKVLPFYRFGEYYFNGSSTS